MPLDPTISLQVAGGGGPGAAANPTTTMLGQLDTMSQLQNRMNQNRQFQLTLQARQEAGQILAASPDLDTGIKSILASPTAGPWSGDFVNTIRQSMLADTQAQGERQKQALEGINKIMLAAAGSAGAPGMLAPTVGAVFAGMSPGAQKTVAGATQAMLTSLMPYGAGQDSSKWTPEQTNQYKQNVAALAVAAGLDPKIFEITAGTPYQLDRGGSIEFGMQNRATGQRTPTGGTDKSLVPALVGVGGAQMPVGGTYGFPGMGENALLPAPSGAGANVSGTGVPTSGNALGGQANLPVPPIPPEQQQQLQQQSSGTGAGAGAVAPTSPLPFEPPPAGMSGAGKSLVPEGTIQPLTGVRGIGGVVVQTPNELEQNKILLEDQKKGTQSYQSAQTTMGQLTLMSNIFDSLARSQDSAGDWLQPGSTGTLRAQVAGLANAFAQIMGKSELPFDPTKIGQVDTLNKTIKNMGLSVINESLGGGREAAQTIQTIMAAVPSLENSYLGAKLIMGSMAATAQRIIDKQVFFDEWARARQGSLIGAAQAFNKLHPAQEYQQRVLDNLGMDSKGRFDSPEAVRTMYHRGLLTEKMAGDIIRNQFGGVTGRE